MKIKLEE